MKKKIVTQTLQVPIELDSSQRSKFLKNAKIEKSETDGGIVIKKLLGDFVPHSSTQIDGEKSEQDISAEVTFVYASAEFIKKFDTILNSLGIEDVVYKCGIIEQANQMTKPNLRDMGIVLIDTGYLTTSVIAVKGDKIESLYSFSLGGAHLTADLSQAFDLPFKVAEELKRKVLLSVDPSEIDYYTVTDEGKQKAYELKASQVNTIIKEEIEHIARMIAKCISEDNYAYHFIVTGGGLSEVKGALNVLSSALGVVCNSEKLEMANLNTYEQSCITSMIKSAYINEKAEYQNLPFYKKWWQKIKSVFKR